MSSSTASACPARHSATTPRGSIAAPAVRWLTIRARPRRRRRERGLDVPAGQRPLEHLVGAEVLVDDRAPSLSAASGSVTTGSGSYSTTTSSAASTTAYLSSPMTTATGLADVPTLPRASGQCSGTLTSTPGGTQTIGQRRGQVAHVLAGEDRVDAGARRAAAVSIEMIRACASGERTIAANSIPARTMSSTYVAAAGDEPRVLLAPHRAGRCGRCRAARSVQRLYAWCAHACASSRTSGRASPAPISAAAARTALTML